jgi:hypothetical protein
MIDWEGGKEALRWTAARRFQSGPRNKTRDSRKAAARTVALVAGSVRAL